MGLPMGLLMWFSMQFILLLMQLLMLRKGMLASETTIIAFLTKQWMTTKIILVLSNANANAEQY